VDQRARQIYEAVLSRSRNVAKGNFTAISPVDLQLLFDLYDAAFFDGLLGAMLRGSPSELTFRFSRRMTSAAGTTTFRRMRTAGGKAGTPPVVDRYEITISIVILFNNFGAIERPVAVGGVVCSDRLEALQRVFEHELLHLAEFLAWGRSSCAEAREVAATTYDVRVGDMVSFEHEGMGFVGCVRRITRRATVLVDDPTGELYSDGKRYARFYVPLGRLRKENLGGESRDA
jgi:hypothetical protein